MRRQVYHYYDYKPSARHNTATEGNTYCILHFNLFAVVLSSGLGITLSCISRTDI